MVRIGLRVCGTVCFVAAALAVWCARGGAIPLDKDGDMKLGVRAYVNARIGTNTTTDQRTFIPGNPPTTAVESFESRTFPDSAAGHLRQNRWFIEAEYDHDLERLVKEGVGPFGLLQDLPFKVKGLKYHLTFRGEYDGVYDFGPREFSSASQYTNGGTTGTCVKRANGTCDPSLLTTSNLPINPVTGNTIDVLQARQNLRALGTDRERLFQAYMEASVGSLFIRFGRQILSWGETDGFRLLDQINPVDSSFGGFLVSLDERRVPLDMLRAQYFIGDIGPVQEAFLEMYAAIDNKVGFAPGTPAGSPWTLPNLGAPSTTTLTTLETPRRTIGDTRGGGRLYWNMFDATFSLAHYYTYFDTPAVQVFVCAGANGKAIPGCDPNGLGFPAQGFADLYSAHAVQSAPLVQITGASTTFALPSLYSVIRSEFAYFHGEPRFRQENLDPFIFHNSSRNPTFTGGRDLGDSANVVIGADTNQWVRLLNSNETFFISTQLFVKHLFGADPRVKINGKDIYTGEVLPVPAANLGLPGAQNTLGAIEPDFIHQETDQFLQTLFIATSYRSGTVSPSMTFFYDWSGSMVFQPSVTFSHDPFRFIVDYSILDAGSLKGNSGVSLLRDRDNIQFRFEYVI